MVGAFFLAPKTGDSKGVSRMWIWSFRLTQTRKVRRWIRQVVFFGVEVTKQYMSKTGVAGRPHLGVFLARSMEVLGRLISQISS